MDARDLTKPSPENELNENLETQQESTGSQKIEIKNETPPDHDELSHVEEEVVDSVSGGEEAKEEKTPSKNAEPPVTDAVSKLQEEPNYASMKKSELVDRMVLILENKSLSGLKDRVELIKQNFYKKNREEIASAKAKFIADGGAEKDFEIGGDELQVKMKELLQKFKDRRSQISRNLEQEKESNLQEKYKIIEGIKDLVHREEAFDKTFHEFRELQKKWHEIGMVPQQALKNMWDTYHHHVENFYDYIKINKELRDLDLKKNLALKIRLCEEAEKLIDEPSVVKAFNTLQKHHEQWREIGPVPREQKEDLWTRFKSATTIINRKHQGFYENLKSDQKKNLEQKEVLCEKAEAIANAEIGSHKDWNTTSKQIIDLQKEWRTIGFAPKKDNNRIYQRFRAACDLYFNRKRDYYLQLKDVLNENLVKKTSLCVTAEELQDSTDWKETTEKLIAIQKQWKKTGPVPRKVSEELWLRFRAACDKFFNNKAEHYDNVDSDYVVNLNLKQDLIDKVNTYELSEDNEINLSAIRSFQKEWSEIGHVPFKKKDKIQVDFRKAINSLYEKMNLDNENLEVQKFRSKIDSFLSMDHSEDKIINERNKIVTKIKQLESDISLWENNIGFFSSSKNSTVVKDIEQKIERGKENLNILNQKLLVIDSLV
ncbi:DUF349 domain-containing protein [Ancylomarina longa]|uniref:DUF349 domain-containing protein n=1 Tax=Ancylomarina longa TaxID=2487017 RepID=A0A434ATW3_9BACT|nr:DUF349 domain-containing protein [Ancylomarina longa]RUT77858.1 DUF349 domain-containing protein [Ancylomarina longa]